MVLLGVIELYKSDGKSVGIYNRCRQARVTGMLILSHCKVQAYKVKYITHKKGKLNPF